MKTIYLERLGEKELNMTLEEYINYQNDNVNILPIQPNQYVLINLSDRYFFGKIEKNKDMFPYKGAYSYQFNGYYIYNHALWEINESKYFTSNKINTIIINDNILMMKIKNLVKQTTSFKNNILSQIYKNTTKNHIFRNDNIITREQYNRLSENDILFQNKKLTLREILCIKNKEYDAKFSRALEQINIGKQYIDKMMFYERFDDRILIPKNDEMFDILTFTENGFYTEICKHIVFNENYKIILNPTDEYNIKLNVNNIIQHFNEIKDLCRQNF